MVKYIAEAIARFFGLGEMPKCIPDEAWKDPRWANSPASFTATPAPYVDGGVFYFYAEPHGMRQMKRLLHLKTVKGTYRCDGLGKYFFSKKDKGTPVIILFTFEGKMQRRQVTI